MILAAPPPAPVPVATVSTPAGQCLTLTGSASSHGTNDVLAPCQPTNVFQRWSWSQSTGQLAVYGTDPAHYLSARGSHLAISALPRAWSYAGPHTLAVRGRFLTQTGQRLSVRRHASPGQTWYIFLTG
jgi:hypothetical protein